MSSSSGRGPGEGQPTARAHWLTDVAAHAGMELRLPPNPPFSAVRKAWPVVARACKVTDDQLVRRVARHFRLGVADLSTWDPQAVALLPEKVARGHGILPMSFTDTTVVVATSDPSSRDARLDIIAHSGRQPVFLMGSPSAIWLATDKAYAPVRSVRSTLQTLVTEASSDEFQIVTTHGPGIVTSFELEAPAVVELTDVIFRQALRFDATEILMEPGRDGGRVRYRIDGVLQHYLDLPLTAYERVGARIASLAERPSTAPKGRRPGTFSLPTKGNEALEATLQRTATPDGERVLVRIADPRRRPTLADLGFDTTVRTQLRELLSHPDGFILITGPARSGKTSLVYSILLAGRGLNVVSLENPVELLLPGVTQVPFDAEGGLSYAETLQQLLGQGPELMHAGEVRDLATARTVLRAAMTGRRVVATVHTSDAVSGIRRLLDLGLAPGRLAESLRAVVSVRLVRSLCSACSKEVSGPEDLPSRERQLAESVGTLPARRAVGCPECGGTGYKGQLPLAEVLPSSAALLTAIAEASTERELEEAAQAEGMRTFLDVARERVEEGRTTLQEVERVLGLLPQRDASAGAVGPVLVVEDEAQDRLLIRAVLQDMGFNVVEAVDGPPALSLIDQKEHDFSLVILDLFMPEMHGMEVLKRIRSSLATQSLPVIVLTASPNPRDEIELLDAGADDYLLKPIVTDRLVARARAVLRRSGVRLTNDGGPLSRSEEGR